VDRGDRKLQLKTPSRPNRLFSWLPGGNRIAVWGGDQLRKVEDIELQTALGEATQTDKRTAGVFLDTLSPTSDGVFAYKETKKNGEFVVPGFDKGSATEANSDHSRSHGPELVPYDDFAI
jgi:hypothetical protein